MSAILPTETTDRVFHQPVSAARSVLAAQQQVVTVTGTLEVTGFVANKRTAITRPML